MIYDPKTIEDLVYLCGCAVRKEKPLNDSEKIALMRYFSRKEKLEDIEFKAFDELISSYIIKGVYFGFYKEMDRRLTLKYHFYDKMFVEYEGRPGQRLVVEYSINDEERHTDDFIEMYPGIYVRSFVMFFGDQLTYTVRRHDGSEILYEGQVTYTKVVDYDSKSRYERLNAMLNDLIYSNDKDLLYKMKEYQGLLCVTDRLFTML